MIDGKFLEFRNNTSCADRLIQPLVAPTARKETQAHSGSVVVCAIPNGWHVPAF